jgi:dipeptidyl aminopeptidase/acylaminoacyl peptidase
LTEGRRTTPHFEQFYAIRRLLPTLGFAADGEHILYSTNASGQFNLWRVPVGGGCPEQLTSFEEHSVRGDAWLPPGAGLAVSRDGRIVFTADFQGDEFGQLYELADGWPVSWTDAPGVQHNITPNAFSPDGTKLAYAANANDEEDMECFVHDVKTGESSAVFGEGRYSLPATWSPDGRVLLCVDVRGSADFGLFMVDLDTGEAAELTPHEGDARYAPGPWARGGAGFYLLSDEGREFPAIAFFRLATRSLEWVETPEREIEELAGSADGRVLGWVENDDGYGRVRFRDLELGVDLPEPTLPRGCPSALGTGMSFSRDGSHAALIWTDPRRPADLYVIETATGAATRLTNGMLGALEPDALLDPELIHYESFDGRRIPAWIYRPASDSTAPVVLAIHGGPQAQERPLYNSLYQYLLSRGIGVMATNIRGSTGYGKTYEALIHRDWGGGDFKDLEHAVEWLRRQDWVDDDRLGVYGASYGGFATLTCLSRLPDVWAAAVDIVGPSNLITFVRAVPPSWRRLTDAWVGNPDTEADFLRERSPITYVDQVRAPLLVMQGAHDPRVVQAESDQMVERLRELGREVEYVVFEDEGHGFTKRANQSRSARLTVDWFEKYLARA